MVRSELSVNNFFSFSFRLLGRSEIPGTALVVCPLFGGSRRPSLLSWLSAGTAGSRRPGALLYGRTPRLARRFLHSCEIFCPILGRTKLYPCVAPCLGMGLRPSKGRFFAESAERMARNMVEAGFGNRLCTAE